MAGGGGVTATQRRLMEQLGAGSGAALLRLTARRRCTLFYFISMYV